MATRKKKPWNAGLKMPGLGGEPPSKTPRPMPFSGLLGHSTPGAPAEEWQCLRCDQLALGNEPTVPEHSFRCPKREPAGKS